MRVLVVTHSYPRWEGDVAGAFIERLNLGLTGLGHRLDVVVPADRGTRGSYNHNGILVHRAAYGSRGNETLAYTGRMSEALKSPFGIFRFLNLVGGIQREVRRLWGSGEFDLVHAHWWVPGGLAVVRSGGRPYVLTLHGTDVALLEKIPMVRALAAGVIRNAAARTTVSSYLARRAAVFSRLDVSDFEVQPMPPRIELAAEPARGDAIVTVGRLTKQKRVDVIVRALSVMKREGHEHSLLVVGDGPERSNLERLAQALDVAVEFVGEVSPSDVAAHLAGARLFAFAAEGEGLGLAVAEGLMAGLPVVAVDSGGVPDLLGNDAGLLVPPNDPTALANAMLELLDDSRAGARALAAGKELSQRLSTKHAADFFDRIYRDVRI